MECAASTVDSVLDTLGVDISCQTNCISKKENLPKKRDEKLALEGIGLPLEVGSSL